MNTVSGAHLEKQSAAGRGPDASAFPAAGTAAQRLRFMLAYAVMAPSNHNTQPWHFVLQEDSVQVCADRRRALPAVDPYDRELAISCGAALFNLRVALAHFGQPWRIALFPYPADPDVLAQVWIDARGFLDATLVPLFASLSKRMTNRQDYAAEVLPAGLREAMQAAAAEEGAGLAFMLEEERRLNAAELIAEADRIQFADAAFRRELAMWTHGSRKDDGMPAFARGVAQLMDFARPMMGSVVRSFDAGAGVAASHRRLAQGSPALLALSTAQDNAEAWLCAGQALERILLLAEEAGFSASYLNQPVEVPALRRALRTMAATDAYPQLLLRMGKAPPDRRSPRRQLEEVIW